MKKLFTLLCILCSLYSNGQGMKTLSISEQVEDIEYIQKKFEELHPRLYTFQTEQEFAEAVDSLKLTLKEDQTVFQFYNSLVPVLNQIGCGHTTVKIPKKDLKKFQKNCSLFPLEIEICEDRIFISDILPDQHSIEPETEILSINGTKSPDYIQHNLNRYPSDGRIESRKYQFLEKNFAIDYAKFYPKTGEYVLEINKNGEVRKLTLQGISYDSYLASFRQEKAINLEFLIIDTLSTAIITIRNSSSKKQFSTFLASCFSQIRNSEIKNLIIDLRYDSFNRDSDGAELYSYLNEAPFRYYRSLETTENYKVPKSIRWITHYPIEQDSSGKYYWMIHPQLELQKPVEQAFEGRVFVLTDGFTFSATSEFSSVVQSNERGWIVGQETGGGYYGNNSGGMMRLTLPNSKLIVVLPPLKYTMAVKDIGKYDRGVIPDVPVNKCIHDITSDEDQILNASLEFIFLNP